MIIVLNKQIEPGDKERIVGYLKEKGFRIREIQGESDTVLGAVGSVAVDRSQIQVLPGSFRFPNRTSWRPANSKKKIPSLKSAASKSAATVFA